MPERDRDKELAELLQLAHQHGLPDLTEMLTPIGLQQPAFEVKIKISDSGTADIDANT